DSENNDNVVYNRAGLKTKIHRSVSQGAAMSFFSNIKSTTCLVAPVLVAAFALATPAATQTANKPWMNTALSAEKRAELLEKEMTQEERLSMVIGVMSNPMIFQGEMPADMIPSA